MTERKDIPLAYRWRLEDTYEDVYKRQLYTCPNCHKPVDFTPLGPDNAPIAKPYRE